MKVSSPTLRRAASLLAAAVVSAAAVIGPGAPAQAAPLGTITLTPANGTTAATVPFTSATTATGCPATHKDNVSLRIGPADKSRLANLAPIGSTGDYTAPFSLTPNRSMDRALDTDLTEPWAPAPNGDYLVVIVCSSASQGAYDDRFETTITVTDGQWQVKSAGAASTTTSLRVAPSGPVSAGTAVTLTASVNPATAAGTVEFRDGGVKLGTAPVAGGSAALTTSGLAAGSRSLTAVFTPADSAAYLSSTSAAVPLEVTAPSGGGGENGQQKITAVIEGGGLTLELAGTDVTLAGGTLGGTATGDLKKATVTDARGDNSGWALVGQVSPFTGTPGGTIPANQLGWVPSVTKVSGSGAAGAGSPASPGSGLGTARALCTAASGASSGVFDCKAGLTLGVPGDTVPGTYTATLTLTLS